VTQERTGRLQATEIDLHPILTKMTHNNRPNNDTDEENGIQQKPRRRIAVSPIKRTRLDEKRKGVIHEKQIAKSIRINNYLSGGSSLIFYIKTYFIS